MGVGRIASEKYFSPFYNYKLNFTVLKNPVNLSAYNNTDVCLCYISKVTTINQYIVCTCKYEYQLNIENCGYSLKPIQTKTHVFAINPETTCNPFKREPHSLSFR